MGKTFLGPVKKNKVNFGSDESKTQLGRFAFRLKAGFRGANSETDLFQVGFRYINCKEVYSAYDHSITIQS
jgi:hypothetical protein